jgi:hypothetical protein
MRCASLLSLSIPCEDHRDRIRIEQVIKCTSSFMQSNMKEARMLTPEMKELMRKQVELSIQLSEETSRFVSDVNNLATIIEPLKDGSIDAGDFESVSGALITIIKSFAAYNGLVTLMRDNRETFSQLYRTISNSNEADFDSFIALTQHLSAEVATAKMFNQLVAMKVLVDKRA